MDFELVSDWGIDSILTDNQNDSLFRKKIIRKKKSKRSKDLTFDLNHAQKLSLNLKTKSKYSGVQIESTSNSPSEKNMKQLGNASIKRSVPITKEVVNNSKLSAKKLKIMLHDSPDENIRYKSSKQSSALDKLNAAKFRFINEKLYSISGEEATKYFENSPEDFEIYHHGYQNQLNKWPVNPIEIITEDLLKSPNNGSCKCTVADLGCGNAILYEKLKDMKQFIIHSFDLVSTKPHVIACDMAHTPLKYSSVDVCVFCLSLMGINIDDFILEANRILRKSGTLYVAEVTSRFTNIKEFLLTLKKHFGFKCDLSTDEKLSTHFTMFRFKKIRNVKKKAEKSTEYFLKLLPCKYKKR